MRLKLYFSISEIYHSKMCLNLHRPPCILLFDCNKRKVLLINNYTYMYILHTSEEKYHDDLALSLNRSEIYPWSYVMELNIYQWEDWIIWHSHRFGGWHVYLNKMFKGMFSNLNEPKNVHQTRPIWSTNKWICIVI